MFLLTVRAVSFSTGRQESASRTQVWTRNTTQGRPCLQDEGSLSVPGVGIWGQDERWGGREESQPSRWVSRSLLGDWVERNLRWVLWRPCWDDPGAPHSVLLEGPGVGHPSWWRCALPAALTHPLSCRICPEPRRRKGRTHGSQLAPREPGDKGADTALVC